MPIIVDYADGKRVDYMDFASIKDPSNVKKLHFGSMKFKTLPALNFPNLEEFSCHNNELELLPEVLDFPKLRYFDCSGNRLTRLPENMHFPALQFFYCHKNKLTHLPKAITCPNLRYFYCCDNKLTALPDYIVYWKQMILFNYSSNPIPSSGITQEQTDYLDELKKYVSSS